MARSSIYTGVYYDKARSHWGASVKYEGWKYWLGYHDDEREAVEAVNRACHVLGKPIPPANLEIGMADLAKVEPYLARARQKMQKSAQESAQKPGQTIAKTLVERWREGGSWDTFIADLPAGIKSQAARRILVGMREIHFCEKCQIILEMCDADVRKNERDGLCGACANGE